MRYILTVLSILATVSVSAHAAEPAQGREQAVAARSILDAWQLDSPELDATNLSLTKPMIQDGQYGRISLGKHNSIFTGGIAHELGHAPGLPHREARPDEAVRGTALMGSGNQTYGDEVRGEGRGSFLMLAHALRLASHPQFSGSVRALWLEPKLRRAQQGV